MSNLIGTLYKSTTGLNAYTQGLDNLSTNVANLNTPGFKGRELQFRELADKDYGNGSPNDRHQGVEVTGFTYRFVQGDTTETGNATDLAINGNGFFVLHASEGVTHHGASKTGNDINSHYLTRAGQFTINEEGYLVDPGSGYYVQTLEDQRLQSINFNDLNASEPETTTEIRFRGNLNSNTSTGDTFPGEDDEALTVSVIDAAGQEREVTVEFTKQVGNHWEVSLLGEEGNALAPSQTLSFGGNGRPIDESPLVFDFQPFVLADNGLVTDTFSALADASENLATSANPEPTEASENNNSNSEAATILTFSGTALTDANPTVLAIPAALLSESEGEAPQFITQQDGQVQLNSELTLTIDDEGYLIDQESQFRVAALDQQQITDINLSDLATFPAQATSTVSIAGNLIPSNNGNNEPTGELVDTVEILNAQGETISLTMTYQQISNLTDGKTDWTLTISNDQGETVSDPLTLSFDENGQLMTNELSDQWTTDISLQDNDGITLDFTNGTNQPTLSQQVNQSKSITTTAGESAPESHIERITVNHEGQLVIIYQNGETRSGPTLALGQQDGVAIEGLALHFDNNATGFSSSESTLNIDSSDGRPLGELVSFQFDENGQINLSYSNGEEVEGPKVALASVTNLNTLKGAEDTLFQITDETKFQLGHANEKGLGSIEPNSIELSNVELSQEFSDIIIVQRGYQATSQILSVTNEMIEELYNSVGGR